MHIQDVFEIGTLDAQDAWVFTVTMFGRHPTFRDV